MALVDELTLTILDEELFIDYLKSHGEDERLARELARLHNRSAALSLQRLQTLIAGGVRDYKAVVDAALLRFQGTDGVRGLTEPTIYSPKESIRLFLEKKTISPTFIYLLTRAFLEHFSPSICYVGDDGREGKEKPLAKAALAAVEASSVQGSYLSTVVTPTMAYASLRPDTVAIMLTASHNPPEYNGLKCFVNGKKLSLAEEYALTLKVIALAREEGIPTIETQALTQTGQEIIEAFTAVVAEAFSPQERATLRTLPIVIDCANGAGSELSNQLGMRLGFSPTILYTSENGGLINHGCGAALWEGVDHVPFDGPYPAQLAKEVAQRCKDEGRATYGLALDGDGDRAIVLIAYSPNTPIQVLHGDEMAQVLIPTLINENPRANEVYSTIESDPAVLASLKEAYKDLHFIQTSVGDRWLSFGDQEQLLLGFEQSGHVLWPIKNENGLLTSGNGLITGLKVIGRLATHVESFIQRSSRMTWSVMTAASSLWYYGSPFFTSVQAALENALGERFKRTVFKEDMNVLFYQTALGESLYARASGTEPKIQVIFPQELKNQLEKVTESIQTLSESFPY